MTAPEKLVDELERIAEAVYENAGDQTEEEHRELERDANTLYRAANTLRNLIEAEVIGPESGPR